jgi:hypothetical protein
VSHGGVEESQLLLVVAEVGSAGARFDQPDEKIRGRGWEKWVSREKLVS